MPDKFVKVARLDEIAPGKTRRVEVGQDEILLSNVNGRIYACDDICSHSYALLSEGDLYGTEVVCPLHGSIFDVTTGKVITPPADQDIRVFEVLVEGQDILVGPEKK